MRRFFAKMFNSAVRRDRTSNRTTTPSNQYLNANGEIDQEVFANSFADTILGDINKLMNFPNINDEIAKFLVERARAKKLPITIKTLNLNLGLTISFLELLGVKLINIGATRQTTRNYKEAKISEIDTVINELNQRLQMQINILRNRFTINGTQINFETVLKPIMLQIGREISLILNIDMNINRYKISIDAIPKLINGITDNILGYLTTNEATTYGNTQQNLNFLLRRGVSADIIEPSNIFSPYNPKMAIIWTSGKIHNFLFLGQIINDFVYDAHSQSLRHILQTQPIQTSFSYHAINVHPVVQAQVITPSNTNQLPQPIQTSVSYPMVQTRVITPSNTNQLPQPRSLPASIPIQANQPSNAQLIIQSSPFYNASSPSATPQPPTQTSMQGMQPPVAHEKPRQ